MIQCFDQLLDGRMLHQRRISTYLGHQVVRVLLCTPHEQTEDRSLTNKA
jgi:hypothetical protein